ncbi:C10 family peptidase [Ornithobacterium rhinotracheale]|uniref:C10 family peptidase n=1 Tax=Ornithobacterium rhinotracheale TaxID=28251 RepID=UPI00403528CA
MKKKIILSSAVLIGLLACNENNLEESVSPKLEEPKVSLKSYEYNYKDRELLEISSLLLKEEDYSEGSPTARMISSQDNSERIRDLELSYLGLGQEKDSLIVAVHNIQTGNAVILSKDKRTDPILGYVDDYNATFIPPEMKFYLSSTADALSEEIDEAMKSPEISAKLKGLDGNINAYFTDLAKQKAENIRKSIFARQATRERRSLDDIMRHENVAYVKGPYIQTEWRQRNSFIKKYHPNEKGVEGRTVTAIGQILNYYGDYVSEIHFGNPFGGRYYDKFTKKSFSYPFKNSSLDHEDYEEILFNISEQITRGHDSGRSAIVTNPVPFTRDLRTFIEKHVKGVRIDDESGLFNVRRPDEHYIIKAIKEGYPAIAGGSEPWYNGYRKGHAWVCDGVVCVRVKRGFIVKWTEHKYYIHMNWGWGGDGNGWFFNNGNDRYKTSDANREILVMFSVAPDKK